MNIVEYTTHDPMSKSIYISSKDRRYGNDRVVELVIQTPTKFGTASLYTKVKNPILQINNEAGTLYAQVVLELDPAYKPYKVTGINLLTAQKTEANEDVYQYKITITGAK